MNYINIRFKNVHLTNKTNKQVHLTAKRNITLFTSPTKGFAVEGKHIKHIEYKRRKRKKKTHHLNGENNTCHAQRGN